MFHLSPGFFTEKFNNTNRYEAYSGIPIIIVLQDIVAVSSASRTACRIMTFDLHPMRV